MQQRDLASNLNNSIIYICFNALNISVFGKQSPKLRHQMISGEQGQSVEQVGDMDFRRAVKIFMIRTQTNKNL